MKAPDHFTTIRLRLRRPALADAELVFRRYASDPEVTKFLGWPRHTSVEQTHAFLQFSDAEWEKWPAGPYLIESAGEGGLLGSTGLAFEGTDRAMTGYVLAKDAWGFGYATEALDAMMHLAEILKVRELSALCHPTHRASQRVLEKCGFVRQLELVHSAFPNFADGSVAEAFRFVRPFPIPAA
ncbi:MAG TPA: GNAT family N-acetyltransferase [Candidatus Acidoferrales bacterium]|nr:GNAT family N-acetyltransferase [Candidatus Acidoferrales bacterium]